LDRVVARDGAQAREHLVEERVHRGRGRARPPAVERRLADLGALGDRLRRDAVDAVAAQQVERRAQDRAPRAFATRTAAGTPCFLVATARTGLEALLHRSPSLD